MRILSYHIVGRMGGIMGEYECTDCNEMFWADEPSEDRDICDECRAEIKENNNG